MKLVDLDEADLEVKLDQDASLTWILKTMTFEADLVFNQIEIYTCKLTFLPFACHNS